MDLGGTNRVQELPDNDTEWEAAVAVKLMCSGYKELASSLRNKKFCKGARVHTFSPPRHHEVYVVG
ncbi:hypothetical protein OsI_22265 [Oryza sativa Indica Group]|uniref:Uncharacterized protein n=2 Tax=Oryza sativa TaxID=4530 RepID=Q67X38_ORYSJ|nr:hypothetical protein OsI_22265 [Oryza sativa Indica Group]BAD37281.1 hypothetical protein [Oryza sativa Japonica Group]